jgi:poly-gamma-glutamate synthesis protein (capsule biosynthesis protein)
MQKKSDFKTSKFRRKKANPKKGLKRNSLVFCTLVLFICSIFVRFIQIFAEWMENLFLTYTKIQQQQHELYCLEHDDIACIWTSFKNIELPNFSNPSYIVAGGDVMLSRYIGTLWKREWYGRIFKEWNYNPLNEFENCKSDNCLLFLNLESLFCEPDNDVPKWGFDFRSNPKNIETLLQYRQDKPLLLALTNNHFPNWWYQWLTITKDLLDKHNIGYVWAGLTQEESREIFSWENNNMKFCLWAYSYDGKSARIRGWIVYWNGINEEEIKSDLQKMKDMNCDVKIVSLHRWAEYRFSPNNWQRNLAHSLIDSWADLILWGHSHIPWEFEMYKGKYIFYSLGNFLFDQSRWKRESWGGYSYFYDADLKRNNVPTYISMLVWLKFERNLMRWIDINLYQIEFSSTTDGLFWIVWEETRNNLLGKINRTNISF